MADVTLFRTRGALKSPTTLTSSKRPHEREQASTSCDAIAEPNAGEQGDRCGAAAAPPATHLRLVSDNVISADAIESKRKPCSRCRSARKTLGMLKQLLDEGKVRRCELSDGSNVMAFVVPIGTDEYLVEMIKQLGE